jgi:integrase
MARSKRYYQYDSPHGKLWAYRRSYKGRQLRKRGFTNKADAERNLREAMNEIDAIERGEVRAKPTTMQDALNIYRRNLDVRGADKSGQYRHNVKSICKVLQEFVDRVGGKRLVREVSEADLREFYQVLCFRMTRSGAATYMTRVLGMLKCAQENRPDLANWLKPKIKVRKTVTYERRAVEPDEYAKLVNVLLHPPEAPSHKRERNALWREAADVVQLLRLTGGRLNEVARLRMNQLNFAKRTVRLFASKTENERDVPMSNGALELLHARIRDGLVDDEYLFPKARYETFDNLIARACRKAASETDLKYGQKNGFTLHSLRHTFITDLLLKTRDIAGTMKLSGHKSLASFSTYLHLLDTGYTNAVEVLDSVDHFLTTFERNGRQERQQRQNSRPVKLLTRKRVAVS